MNKFQAILAIKKVIKNEEIDKIEKNFIKTLILKLFFLRIKFANSMSYELLISKSSILSII